jgi:hypothetical protein
MCQRAFRADKFVKSMTILSDLASGAEEMQGEPVFSGLVGKLPVRRGRKLAVG